MRETKTDQECVSEVIRLVDEILAPRVTEELLGTRRNLSDHIASAVLPEGVTVEKLSAALEGVEKGALFLVLLLEHMFHLENVGSGIPGLQDRLRTRMLEGLKAMAEGR